MKASNKIMLTEFKSRLKKIINTHPSESVRFSQFMELLTINFIRVYSRTEVGKIFKFFDNPLKICRMTLPLSYFSLQCVQESEKKKYFVIKISPTQVYLDLSDFKEKKHSTARCLESFIKIMKNLYGSERNWFKALGGLTVAVTISPTAFKKSLSSVLRNTNHTQCVQDIMKVFLKESSTMNIEWKGFMKVISDHDLSKSYVTETKPNWTSSSFASVQVSKILFDYQKPSETESKNRGTFSPQRSRMIQSAHSKVPISISRKRSIKTASQDQSVKPQVQFPRFFSISAKPCVLYDKKAQFMNTFATSFRPTTKQSSVYRHRKTRTQPNFFEQMSTQPRASQSFKQEKSEYLGDSTGILPDKQGKLQNNE